MNQANQVRPDYQKLNTEARNPRTKEIDTLPTLDMVRLMAEENRVVEDAVAAQAQEIASAIDLIAASLQNGGHLIYVGAGTSGRLGVLDASECPPTFGVDEQLIRAIMAGGESAMFRASEGAEDRAEQGKADLIANGVLAGDIVVGLSASGGAPYVLGALEQAAEIGAVPIGITCNPQSRMHPLCRVTIAPVVGPEVITGSSRLKAGTAQKLVLNMLSTGAMIKTGKVMGNLMINVRPTNQKLRLRCIRIICELTGCDPLVAEQALDTHGEIRAAVASIQKNSPNS